MWHGLCKEGYDTVASSARDLCRRDREKVSMKIVSPKLLWSIIAVALLAPLSAIALIVGARVAEVTQSDGNDWLLVALAFGGAAVSALNGLGRRMAQTGGTSDRRQKVDRQHGAMVHINQ